MLGIGFRRTVSKFFLVCTIVWAMRDLAPIQCSPPHCISLCRCLQDLLAALFFDFLESDLQSLNDNAPFDLVHFLLKCIQIFVLSLDKRNLADQNGFSHVDFRNDIVNHNASLVNLAF